MPFFSSPRAFLTEYPEFRQESLAPKNLLYSLTLVQTISPGFRFGLFLLVAPSNQSAPSEPSCGALMSTIKLSPSLFLMMPMTNWLTSGTQVVTFLMVSMYWWPLFTSSIRQPKQRDLRCYPYWQKLLGLQRLSFAFMVQPGKMNLSLLFWDYWSILLQKI